MMSVRLFLKGAWLIIIGNRSVFEQKGMAVLNGCAFFDEGKGDAEK